MILTRRIALLGGAAIATAPGPMLANAAPITRQIPATGERLPAIGLGSWITFDVQAPSARAECARIVRDFVALGGSLIDSSPMYGRSPDVIGAALSELGAERQIFSASKVWTVGADKGVLQMQRSADRWGVPRFDLMQIHNMLDWRSHLPVLRDMKERDALRYVGITTSHGRRHSALAEALQARAFDVVQFTYNIAERDAEERLLPLAADEGVAVIINRPFATGALFRRVRGRPLPGWAADIQCDAWSQVFLKFVISHPAVTVAIPATSQLTHLRENMVALSGPLPDAALRERMARDFQRL